MRRFKRSFRREPDISTLENYPTFLFWFDNPFALATCVRSPPARRSAHPRTGGMKRASLSA